MHRPATGTRLNRVGIGHRTLSSMKDTPDTMAFAGAAAKRYRPRVSTRDLGPVQRSGQHSVMEKSIFGFIYRYSKKQQIYLLCFTIASFPILYYSLELPKIIINEAIGGVDFPRQFLGFSLDQISYLWVLCLIFLGLVLINGGFKYYLNVYRGLLGERMLRRLRYELYQRVLRFRLPRFKRMSQGEIIPMIVAEVEPLGGFIGDAFAQPAFQGGTLLTYIVFIFIQDPVLGAAAIALYPLQGYLIPKLQRRVNQLGKQRVRTVRQLSDKIGETVSGVQEIHANDTANLQQAEITRLLGRIFEIRFEIYRRKFFIKFLNNFINQITPFFFYSIGGWLVIRGDLSFGALVAVLAAYKDLASPWKELLTYYQMMEDSRIKYEQVVQQFQPEDIMPLAQLIEDRELPRPLPSPLALHNVGVVTEDGERLLEAVTVSLPTDRHIAALGDAGSGRDVFLLLCARLEIPSSGRIRLGEDDLADLPESVTGRRMAYVGAHTTMLTDTLRANLYYSLKHRPLIPPHDEDSDTAAWRRRFLAEALAAGNTKMDAQADWIDYDAAGANGPEELQERALEVLNAVEMAGDVYRMGLNGTIDHTTHADIAERVLQARSAVRERLQADPGTAALVELFRADAYNTSATVAENLLFGTPVGPTLAPESIAEQPYVLSTLENVGLVDEFLRIGLRVAETMIELFADLPPGHEFFEQFSFISSDELPDFQPLITKARADGVQSLRPEARARLMALPFKLIVARHRLGLIGDDLRRRIVEARHRFAADLPTELQGCIEFFDADRYNGAATLQDNILFGKVAYGPAATQEKVQALIADVVDQLDLRRTVVAVGLDYSVGVAGARLSLVQRQKLALARALLKRPDLLILNEATSVLDGATQQRVAAAVRQRMADKGLIWGLHRPSLGREFKDVLVFKSGRLVGEGSFAELEEGNGAMRELLAAE